MQERARCDCGKIRNLTHRRRRVRHCGRTNVPQQAQCAKKQTTGAVGRLPTRGVTVVAYHDNSHEASNCLLMGMDNGDCLALQNLSMT
ncbi:hypothetical protein NDU88_002485 [Pleurodeles waltl]|uniref:Uncharacterized protein n=1 Tax=Pleurodeles waltl TaxID=8319 RepID=A0AAV7WNP8_PLEWA|nr:hypothetical protein NDU88_002485 [Pleurodeles waltl]